MEGSTYGIITQPPTDDKIHEFQRILLPYEFDWDPSNNLFEMYSMEEEYRTSSNFNHYIDIYGRIIPIVPTNIHCIYQLRLHEFDRSMEKFPIGIDLESMVDRLISNIRVRRPRIGYATYVDKKTMV